MIYKNKKILALLFGTFMVSISSCYSKIENINNNVILKEIDFRKGATINLKIANLDSFETKSTSSISEAVLSDVKSLSAFLTKNPQDPFAKGENPFGDSVIISNNYTGELIAFFDVPDGGPYYAVVAAFDDISSSNNKNNISEITPLLTSIENKWYVSKNSVNIINTNNLVFSDTSSTLDVNLILRKPTSNEISTSINISDGTAVDVKGAIGVN
jgi:hypothetical protein